MGDFFVLQMDDSFTESVCFDTSKEGKGELRPHAPPYSAKGKARRAGAPYPGRCGGSDQCPVGTEGGSPDPTIAYLI